MSADKPILQKTHIERIEDGIVRALEGGGLSSRYLIASFPDNPDEFDMSNVERAALVQYTGSRYEMPGSTGSGAQKRRAEFAIHLYLRRVSVPVRAPHEIDQIRLAVQGRHVEGTLLVVTRDGLVDQDGPLWRYVLEVICYLPAIPIPRERPAPFMSDFNKREEA